MALTGPIFKPSEQKSAAATLAANRASKIGKLLKGAAEAKGETAEQLQRIATQFADSLVFDVLEHIANGGCQGDYRHAQQLATTAIVARDACNPKRED